MNIYDRSLYLLLLMVLIFHCTPAPAQEGSSVEAKRLWGHVRTAWSSLDEDAQDPHTHKDAKNLLSEALGELVHLREIDGDEAEVILHLFQQGTIEKRRQHKIQQSLRIEYVRSCLEFLLARTPDREARSAILGEVSRLLEASRREPVSGEEAGGATRRISQYSAFLHLHWTFPVLDPATGAPLMDGHRGLWDRIRKEEVLLKVSRVRRRAVEKLVRCLGRVTDD